MSRGHVHPQQYRHTRTLKRKPNQPYHNKNITEPDTPLMKTRHSGTTLFFFFSLDLGNVKPARWEVKYLLLSAEVHLRSELVLLRLSRAQTRAYQNNSKAIKENNTSHPLQFEVHDLIPQGWIDEHAWKRMKWKPAIERTLTRAAGFLPFSLEFT